MIGLYRFIHGYVKIKLSGEYTEKFLNFFVKNGISFWDIKRGKGSITLCVWIDDYINMPKYRRSVGKDIKVKLIGKYGLPLKIRKIATRSGVCVGLCIFLAINIVMSQFIWKIDVVGNNLIDSDDVISACEELGITVGLYRKNIDTYLYAQRLALMFEDIAWVSLNVEGSVVTVNISEATTSQKENKDPGNIIASYDGVIKRIEVTKGQKNVTLNQAVRKGDLLVSGVTDSGFISSEGEIFAQTYRTFTEHISKNYDMEVASDKTDTRSVLNFFGIKIPLYLRGVGAKESFAYVVRSANLFGKTLPISVIQRTFKNSDIKTVSISENEACNIALGNLSEKIRKMQIEQVQKYTINVSETSEEYIIKIDTVCMENICDYSPINYTED